MFSLTDSLADRKHLIYLFFSLIVFVCYEQAYYKITFSSENVVKFDAIWNI